MPNICCFLENEFSNNFWYIDVEMVISQCQKIIGIILNAIINNLHVWTILFLLNMDILLAKSAGAVEYTDYISEEG